MHLASTTQMENHLKWQIFLPDITNEVMTNNIQPGNPDLLLVHHEKPDHFDSVQGLQNQRWTITSTKGKLITDQLNRIISTYPMITKTIKSKNTEHVEAARLELLHFLLTRKPGYILLH